MTDRQYWRVSPRFWVATAAWSDDARLLGLYLLTSPHRTLEGLFRLPLAYVAADLGWPLERLGEPFRELLADGFAAYDEDAAVVLIVKALDYQAPENPNQVKAALRKLADLPETPLTSTFKGLAERFCEPLAQALPEGFGEGSPEPLAPSLALALTPTPLTREGTQESYPQGDGGGVMQAAATILAEAEADRRGDEIANRNGYVRARIPALITEHRTAWTAVLALDPNTLPEQLAHPPKPSPLDGTQAAARRRWAENAERALQEPDRDDNVNHDGLAAARAARNHTGP